MAGLGNDTIEPGESSDFDDTIYAGAGDDRVLRGVGQAFEDYYFGGARERHHRHRRRPDPARTLQPRHRLHGNRRQSRGLGQLRAL